MTNHFLTTLKNLGDNGTAEEFICPGAPAQSLSGTLADVYLLLFPHPADRAEVHLLAYSYLQLVRASGFGHYFTEKDPRINYHLDRDFDFFLTKTFDLGKVVARLKARKAAVDRMFHDIPLDDTTPMHLWGRHPNPIMQVAGVVIGFVQRAG